MKLHFVWYELLVLALTICLVTGGQLIAAVDVTGKYARAETCSYNDNDDDRW
jgi:hypothetical protein